MQVDIHRSFPRVFGAAAAAFALIASVAAPAAAQTAGSGWQPGPGAILDNTYVGFIDQPSNGATVPGSGSFVVGGWFVDTTAQGWAGADQMQVWLGTMDGGGKMLASGIPGQSRPDVGKALGNPFYANSGFSASVPGGSVPSGNQTLNVYMHTGGKGWWYKSVSVNGGGASSAPAPAPAPSGTPAPISGSSAANAVASGTNGAPVVTITAPTESENVRAAGSSTYTIQGTAVDPTTGAAGIDSVDVWINGEVNSQSGQDLGQATLNGDGSWSLTFSPTKFPSTHTNIYVYAHSKTTGKTTEAIRGFNIVG
jgi:Bacterial Ig domain